MRFIHYLYMVPLALLAACSSNNELASNVATEHPNGEIQLSAGIVEGGSAAVTRAGAEDNHAKHKTLSSGTILALQVNGEWWKGAPTATKTDVTKTTTATIGAETATDSKHNAVTFTSTEKIYWDDYGTADPDNEGTGKGREKGLTIYGVAIDGKTSLPTDLTNIADWTALSWTLHAEQTKAGETSPADMDLLISNNVQPAPGASTSNDGTYKFNDYIAAPTTYTKLLEFRHALSKITVNLKAGDGFPTDEATVHSFAGTPTVELTSNEAKASTKTEWPVVTGKVNVTNGNVDITSSGVGTRSVVTMFHNTSANTGWTESYEALVMPGSEFTADNAIIARINADGNIYYVTAEKIRAAIAALTGFDSSAADAYKTKSGKNYVINVIVNKTEIKVTATVVDWTMVTAETIEPKINITVSFPDPENIAYNQFSFYRSEKEGADWHINGGYTKGGKETTGFYKPSSRITHDYTLGVKSYSWNPQRYWSNHNQHFQFRLVWPRATTRSKVDDPYHPHVEDHTIDGKVCQVIEIKNVEYEPLVKNGNYYDDDYIDDEEGEHDSYENYNNTSSSQHPYPSNLMIARPDINESLECTNNEPGHVTTNMYNGGICATDSRINMQFKYVMSQVEVNLKTTTTDSRVELANAKVEIVNVYNDGYVKLGDREVITSGSIGSYELNNIQDDPATTDVDESVVNSNKRHSAIVPQELIHTSEANDSPTRNVKFRITITNSDGTKDVYYADVAPIKKSGLSDLVAPNGKWESGYHYVYTLNVSKTAISVSASIAKWNKVEASEEVWF